MKKAVSGIMLTVLLIGMLTLAFNIQSLRASATVKSVVLFSWDGVARTVFKELYDAGQLPFIQSPPFVINMMDNWQFNAVTVTRPQHATMFSGYLADVTGIWTNDPTKNLSGASLPQGYSVFERVKNYSNQTRIAGATGKPKNVGDMLGFSPPPAGQPEITYTNEHGFDTFVVHTRLLQDYPPELINTTKNVAGETCLRLAENTPPFFYMFHFADPDHTGHHYGYNSTQYRDAIRACDNITKYICDKLANSAPAIIVTSDHGFGKPTVYSHSNAPNTFLATNLPIRYAEAHEVDVTPTIYDYLEIPIAGFTPAIEGHSLMSIPGDVDGDRDVDIYDITSICTVYGSILGQPQYKPNCDINGDGKIDIYDVVTACIHYGQKNP